MARASYKVKNISLVDNNINNTGYEQYEVIVEWTNKLNEVREVRDIVIVNPHSTIYGKYPKPLFIKYPSRHSFFVNKVNFHSLGDDVDRAIKKNVAKALLKFMYPGTEGRQYVAEIF